MLKILLSCLLICIVNGHNNKRSNDADLQSELMPQELNPFFVPAPIPSRMPSPLRVRRDSDIIMLPENNTMQQVKTYTRIVAGIVLVLSAIVEIVSYIMESYVS